MCNPLVVSTGHGTLTFALPLGDTSPIAALETIMGYFKPLESFRLSKDLYSPQKMANN